MKNLNVNIIRFLVAYLCLNFSANALVKKMDMKIDEKGCKAKKGKSCYGLAWSYYLDDNYSEAVKYYKLACDLNIAYCKELCRDEKMVLKDYWDSKACMRVVEAIKTKVQFVEEDRKKVTEDDIKDMIPEYLDYACEMGEIQGCYQYANLRDDNEAWKKACSGGLIPEACMKIGDKEFRNKNYVDAVKYFTIACDKNFKGGCEVLAEAKELMDIENKRLEELRLAKEAEERAKEAEERANNERAREAREKEIQKLNESVQKNRDLCNSGKNYVACLELGIHYSSDAGGAAHKIALEYYQKGCNGGNSKSCYYGGILAKDKFENLALSKQMYLKACDLGDAASCNNLAVLEVGKGNSAEGIRFYIKSCNLGNSKACNSMAALSIDGLNLADARKWLNEACDAGSNIACKKLVSLAKEFYL